MLRKISSIILVILLTISCSKKIVVDTTISEKDKAVEIYNEAVQALIEGDQFYASKKFSEAELILPSVELSAKAALLSGYSLYLLNFYDESSEKLNSYIKKYPGDKNIAYAYYLSTLISYEQILDEKKDLEPLLKAQEKIYFFLENYPDTVYALDLKFKLSLVKNQLAAKELFVAKYYIKVQKWIPAINRLKTIVEDYSETIFIEEALHRLVEVYYKLGLESEAKAAASILGYNYNSSIWYERSFAILNKDYKIKNRKTKNSKKEKKEKGLVKRAISKILGSDEKK